MLSNSAALARNVIAAFPVNSTVPISDVTALSADQTALIIPIPNVPEAFASPAINALVNPNSAWDVWGPGSPVGFLGYGGLVGTPADNDDGYPAVGSWQGALLLFVGGQYRYTFLPSDQCVLLHGNGEDIGFGPNDNVLGDNQGSILVKIIIDPSEDDIAEYNPKDI